MEKSRLYRPQQRYDQFEYSEESWRHRGISYQSKSNEKLLVENYEKSSQGKK